MVIQNKKYSKLKVAKLSMCFKNKISKIFFFEIMTVFTNLTGMDIYDLEKGANHTNNLVKDVQNAFWKDVLLAWAKVKQNHTPETLEDILKSSIWDNKEFKIGEENLT